jgi:hypothetical protein
MVFAETFCTNIQLSKQFTLEEISSFETKFFQKKVILKSLIDTPNVTFSFFGHTCNWKIDSSGTKLIYENKENHSYQYFFMDTLKYLIDYYFDLKNIIVNGSVYGKECIFNEYFEYVIQENKIISMK